MNGKVLMPTVDAVGVDFVLKIYIPSKQHMQVSVG